jgi:hypothetical protein
MAMAMQDASSPARMEKGGASKQEWWRRMMDFKSSLNQLQRQVPFCRAGRREKDFFPASAQVFC